MNTDCPILYSNQQNRLPNLMKKPYLNSKKNSALSLQPSKAIYLLLMVLFFSLFGNVANAANISSRSSGNWSSPSTWVGGVVPSSSDVVSINNTVTIDVNVTVQSVNVISTLKVNNGLVFTVGSDVTPGSFTVGGTFSMGTGNDHSTLIVYGNYTNNGETIFYKSDVIIKGNLITPSTSTLQNNGNVIVGGDIIGKFDINGNGTGQIYAVNPNATVTISPSTIDNNVIPGVFPSGELPALITLVNQVIISWCSATTTWNVDANTGVGSWSNGTPTSSKNLIFSGNFNSSTNTLDTVVEGCSCKVNSGAAVVFTSGKTLKISNEIKILGPTGSLTFENNASLVQINEPVTNNPNSGSIIYKRKTTSVLNSDYTYWSSPVIGQKLNISLSYASGMFFSYDDFATPEDWKPETATTVMLIGKGYIIRGSQSISASSISDAAFTGIPNNGTTTIAIGATGTSNLLGNPYPSAINADLFLAANSTLVEGTIYLWTHKTAIQSAGTITNGTAGSGAYAYTSDDYASYNTTGGVGTGNLVKGVEQTVNKPTGKIAAGQAFFTTSKATGTSVTFNNAMRVAGNNSQFFKTKTPNKKTTNTVEKNRVWLNLSNTQGAFKQTLIGYVTDATNDYDSLFDGESFDGNEFVDFYSLNQDRNLVIQGRALPFDETDEVPLGFKSTIDGDFTINIDQVDGSLTNQAVFIEDKLTNTVTDLKSGNYTFNTVAGTFNDRFVLRYTNKSLGSTSFDTQANKVLVSNINKQIKINSFTETIDKVTIYDLLGRQIYQKNKVNNNEFLISDLVLGHQTLIVKTSLQNGNTVTDKIIY